MNQQQTDLILLFKYIQSRCADDVELLSKLKMYYDRYLLPNDDVEGIILEIDSPPQKSHDDKLKEVEEKIKASFIYRDIVEETSSFLKGNTKECIKSIKMIDKVIQTQQKKILLYYGQCGEVLQRMKELEGRKFCKLLEKNGVTYTHDYITFIMRLSKLLTKHNQLLNCSLSIYFIKKYFKLIEEICIKNQW